MKHDRLTTRALAATTHAMELKGHRTGHSFRRLRASVKALTGGALMVAVSGCVSVSAPDKPIVIELNINIKQEVVYRLAADAARTIEENPDIF